MSFTIDFLDDGRVLEWKATADGAVATEREDYTPRFYVAARSPNADIDLTAPRSLYERHPDVVATETVTRRPGFRRDNESVLAVHPGQNVEYVVVDDESSRERVTFVHEDIETYDASYYETQLVRAVESVLSSLNWDRTDIRRELTETRGTDLTAFTGLTDG